MTYCSYHKHARIRARAVGINYTPKQLAAYGGGSEPQRRRQERRRHRGGGFTQKYLDTYFKGLGLSVKPVTVHLGDKRSDGPDGADGEVSLDLRVIGGMAPAPRCTATSLQTRTVGFLDAIHRAIDDKMMPFHSPAVRRFLVFGFAVVFQCALPGRGSRHPHCHPALLATTARRTARPEPMLTSRLLRCPYVSRAVAQPTPCSRLRVRSSGMTARKADGGGVSAVFVVPAYQKSAGVPNGKNRGVPTSR